LYKFVVIVSPVIADPQTKGVLAGWCKKCRSNAAMRQLLHQHHHRREMLVKIPRLRTKLIRRYLNNKYTFKSSDSRSLPRGCAEGRVLTPVRPPQYHVPQTGHCPSALRGGRSASGNVKNLRHGDTRGVSLCCCHS